MFMSKISSTYGTLPTVRTRMISIFTDIAHLKNEM